MSNNKEVTLDDILTRKRRADASKAASAIMGKKRFETVKVVPTKKGRASPTSSGSGVLAGSSNGKWKHDLHHKVNPSASRISKLSTTISPAVARSLQNNRLFAALHGAPTTTITTTTTTAAATKAGGLHIRGTARPTTGTGFQIRGSAAPAVVQASNFAPGTTDADIKHAMRSIGTILSCIILTASPTVISEIVFERKEAAEECIQQYNGQKADGRVLHVFLKKSPPVGSIARAAILQAQLQQQEQQRDPFLEREEADRRRREQNIYFQDGRYGMKPPPIYSDALMQKGRGFSYS